MSDWLSVDSDFPFGVYCPSTTIAEHQEKWHWLVCELNLRYGYEWMLRIPENRHTYDVWCFNDERNALAFCLKWV